MKKVLSRGLAMVMTSVIILTNVDVSAFAATNESIDKTMDIMDIQCPEDKEVSYGTQMENVDFVDYVLKRQSKKFKPFKIQN